MAENVLEGFAAQKETVRESQPGALKACEPKVLMWAIGEPGVMSEGIRVGEFETLFVKHYPRVVGILRRIVGDHGWAEDLANEVFLKLYRRPLAQEPEANVGGWLYRTSTNLGIDALRATARRSRFEQAAGQDARQNKPPENGFERVERFEREQRVRTVLAEIKPPQAQLLVMRASGDSYKELSAALEIEPGSVGTLLVRAEAAFEQRYRELFGSEEDV
ncbi:MAG TPA: sigma-70 family RNA polymerase sigma factor [Methylomirabilota bacterium]|nr:sigma-70 family RNA polymerase sigma factor [Methylomirabilota bacterium]